MVGGLLLLLVAFVFISGMSGLDTQSLERIPVPDKNFEVEVLDLANVRTQLTLFSINGASYLTGKQGRADFTVSFDQLESVEFRAVGDRLEAAVQLKGGHKVQLRMDPRLICSGRTSFGTYRIKAGDVSQIRFLAQIETKQ
jgi:hypothetical protein